MHGLAVHVPGRDQLDGPEPVAFQLLLDGNPAHAPYRTRRMPLLTTSGQTSEALATTPGQIVVRGVGHSFGDKVALQPGLDLDVEPGGVVGLLGPNGSGKSTLMRLLIGLVPKQAGTVTVDGVPLTGDGLDVRRHVTYAPGELHLYSESTGSEQLDFFLRGRDRAARKRATEIARGLGLPLEKRVRGFSHGMKRQLVFAAAMAPDVNVRILDEISEGLDPAKRSEVLERIEADAAEGTTILLSSHHLGEVDRACERILFLNDGRLIADETAEDVRDRAARAIRLTFGSSLGERQLAALAGDDVESVASSGAHVRVFLKSDDPRSFLARMCALDDLPAPRAITHGRISLSELYQSLYGVEGT